eukprot:CAMPEP_0118675358 /NCGR_PEP_ID=MMETSP0800-20121206/1409_1 /TAXON_ID=210618 ORGANISM="Striatella unipunctata, Strain CCMP2910" /NCGR_SAMPLE_ID=MMETSP0800 /ASSEMBLY_ACC=CAM_ASM_000638 /LENGTH=109 /DNA_ID=CAMNT_0006570675 /DNA_START=45 /DNA_END=371 /DNA_ORIENTATION=+
MQQRMMKSTEKYLAMLMIFVLCPPLVEAKGLRALQQNLGQYLDPNYAFTVRCPVFQKSQSSVTTIDGMQSGIPIKFVVPDDGSTCRLYVSVPSEATERTLAVSIMGHEW